MNDGARHPKTLGIVMLNTRFPRPVGDIGNPGSFTGPVRYLTVQAATVDPILASGGPEKSLLGPFIAAVRALSDAGCAVIGTSCGFLTPFQKPLQDRCPVPFLSSSLLQVASVQGALPKGRRAGIITIDAARLGPAHLAVAGVPDGIPVVGLEAGRELHRVILNDETALDARAAEADVIAAGRILAERTPDLGAVVLECTNLGPYKTALSRYLGLPVHDVVDMLNDALEQAV